MITSAMPATIPFRRPDGLPPGWDFPFDPSEQITLRRYYTAVLLPEISAWQSPRSLSEDRIALNRWEEATLNQDLRHISRDDVQQFLDSLQRRGCSPSTINKYWRELRSIFNDAVETGLLDRSPGLGRRRKSKLLKEPVKRQRPTITEAELGLLWVNCSYATYPQRVQFPAPKYWRVALVLFWTYGARTLDMLRELRWSDVRLSERMLQFQAMKTSKLQGLPLTPVVQRHLLSIRGFAERVFPGFNTAGCYLKKQHRWKRGYYTTWREEIGAAEDFTPPITLKHFREAMVTRYNGIEPGLGNWIAGHHVPGVSAEHYDLPTQRVRGRDRVGPRSGLLQ